jgi:hypothetical protein
MGQLKIICEYYDSTDIIKESGCAVVQRVSPETDEPIGKESLFFFFRCLSFSGQLYQQDMEGYVN